MRGAGVLVGRQVELDRVLDVVHDAGPVLLVGDAGIGKTRLVTEVATRLTEQGWQVASAGCLPLAGTLPLLPVVEVLRGLHAQDASSVSGVLDAAPPYVRSDVARVLPELGDAEAAGPGEGWPQERLFAALRSLLAGLAARRQLLMVVEDLHWADSATRDFLTYVMGDSSASRFPLLLTARSEEPEHSEEVRRWLGAVGRSATVTRLVLPPLAAAEVGELATSLVGAHATEELVEELVRRTGGNAFFVEQLLAAGSDGRRVVLPEELAELLRERAGMLPTSARRLLDALSVALRPLTEGELVAVTGLRAETVRAALRELVAVKLAKQAGAGVTTRHALLAEAVEAALLPSERAELHAAVAAVLGARGDPTLAAEAASHWSSANRAEEELKARVAAAGHAEDMYALADAATHWERAVALAEVEPEARSQIAGHAVRGMRAWESAGHGAKAVSLGERALRSTADGQFDHDSATLLSTLAHLHFIEDKARGLRELHEAVQAFDGLPPSVEQVDALHLLYREHLASGHGLEGVPYLRRAIELAESRADARGPLVRALTSLSYLQLRVGDVDAGRATLDRARSLSRTTLDLGATLWVAVAETGALLTLGRLGEVVEVGLADLEHVSSRGMGESFGTSVLLANVTAALLGEGRVGDAAELVDPRTTSTSVHRDRWMVHEARAVIDLTRGALDEAHERLDRIAALVQSPAVQNVVPFLRISAETDVWAQRPAEALTTATAASRLLIDTDEGDLDPRALVLGMRACADLVATAAASRDAAGAAAAAAGVEELVGLRQAASVDPFAEHSFFVAAAAEGLDWQAELARCRREDVPGLWESAARRWEELGRPHRAGYDRWQQARTLLEAGRRPEAIEVLRAAWRLADQHVPLRQGIATLARMARVGLDEPRADEPALSPGPEPPADPYGLTAREVEVLRLVTLGRTNSQIGAQLYMSPKTASVHISAILRKLNAANRVQAAAIAERAGIVSPQQPG